MSLGPMQVPNLREGYVEIIDQLKKHGKEVSPRGYKTWEVEDATFEVLDTTKLLPVNVGRKLNVGIGAGEALLLCAGLGSPSLLTSIAGSFEMFLDGGQLHGAYGPRVRPQMSSAVRRLREDRDSRQAIVQIWDPLYDGTDTRDLPCTLGFGFRIRKGALHMSSTMRSQDAWLGLAYDLFFFGQLGWTVANVLGIEFKSLRHHAYSLHLYERNAEATDKLQRPVGYFWEPTGFGFNEHRVVAEDDPPRHTHQWEFARQRAEDIYNRVKLGGGKTRSEQWYEDVLGNYPRATRRDNFKT